MGRCADSFFRKGPRQRAKERAAVPDADSRIASGSRGYDQVHPPRIRGERETQRLERDVPSPQLLGDAINGLASPGAFLLRR